ncbi:MAG: STAS domain-containing protein [Puniceicoccales bacterium]
MFEIVKNDGAYLLIPEVKSLEAANAAEFKEALDEVDWNACSTASVDCTNIEFIDSSGVGALLHLHHLLGTRARPLKLLHLTPAVLSVVELLRLNTVFSLDSTQ